MSLDFQKCLYINHSTNNLIIQNKGVRHMPLSWVLGIHEHAQGVWTSCSMQKRDCSMQIGKGLSSLSIILTIDAALHWVPQPTTSKGRRVCGNLSLLLLCYSLS